MVQLAAREGAARQDHLPLAEMVVSAAVAAVAAVAAGPLAAQVRPVALVAPGGALEL